MWKSQQPSTANGKSPASVRNRRIVDSARRALASRESFATTLLVVLTDRYGTAVTDWHPETIVRQVQTDLGVELSRVALDRIMAAIVVLTSDDFFNNLPKFNDLCNVLAGSPASPEVFDPADSWEMAWAITEALLLWPPDDEEPFSDDIRYYIGFRLKEDGFVRPPDVLRIALDGDTSELVRTEFASDPEMFQAAYQNQADKTKEVEQMIRGNLTALLGQLEALQLEHGNTAELTGRLRTEISFKSDEGPTREELLAKI